MQANWSIILNVLLLIGVFIAIGRLMKARRQNLNSHIERPFIGSSDDGGMGKCDDIISVRKVSPPFESTAPVLGLSTSTSTPLKSVSREPRLIPSEEPQSASSADGAPVSILMFLLAKDQRQLVGYELLQTILAAGLRFGEGHLFHRHQFQNGKGPVLFSLAAATPTGVFDLQNIGAFSVHGLCLFMHASGNTTIDAERFKTMLDTAKKLSEELNAHLLDDQRQPLSEHSLVRYQRLLMIDEGEIAFA